MFIGVFRINSILNLALIVIYIIHKFSSVYNYSKLDNDYKEHSRKRDSRYSQKTLFKELHASSDLDPGILGREIAHRLGEVSLVSFAFLISKQERLWSPTFCNPEEHFCKIIRCELSICPSKPTCLRAYN